MIKLHAAYAYDHRLRRRLGRYEWRDPTWFGVRWAQAKLIVRNAVRKLATRLNQSSRP